MKIGLSSKTLSLIDLSIDRLLDDPPAAAARARRRQRRDLGRAAAAAARPRRPDAAARREASRSTRSWRPPRTRSTPACCGSPTRAVIGTGGFVDTPNQRLAIRHVPPIVTPDDLAQVAGRAPQRPRASGSATSPTSSTGHPPLFGDAVINDGPGLLLVVEKLPGANTLDVTKGVEEALDELRPGLPGIDDRRDDLPPGDVHRDRDRQPHPRAAARLPAGGRSC